MLDPVKAQCPSVCVCGGGCQTREAEVSGLASRGRGMDRGLSEEKSGKGIGFEM